MLLVESSSLGRPLPAASACASHPLEAVEDQVESVLELVGEALLIVWLLWRAIKGFPVDSADQWGSDGGPAGTAVTLASASPAKT